MLGSQPFLLEMSRSLTPYVSVITTILLLGWTLRLHPSSPHRLSMLFLILVPATITAARAEGFSPSTAWDSFIGGEYGSLLALEAIDYVCLSKFYYDPSLKTEKGQQSVWKWLTWSLDVVINKRKIGTARQVKNIPPTRLLKIDI